MAPISGFAAWLLVMIAVVLRTCMMSLPHSGQGKAPMHGDMEAQRHWMEVTLHLPLHEWYTHTERNDLLYWGLDYPPLTAYVSWLYGALASAAHPTTVAWVTSRGLEEGGTKLFLRLTVLASDVSVYFPAVLSLWVYLHGHGRPSLPATFSLLFSPSLLLIDHAHFQYNTVMLGLTLAAAVASWRQQYLLSALLFTSALNFKQMALYYGPAVFIYMLSACWEGGVEVIVGGKWKAGGKMWTSRLLGVMALGVIVIAVFIALWAPFCVSSAAHGAGCSAGILHVFRRVFPVNRGLFEDKVANLWCALEPVLHFRRRLFGVPFSSAHRVVLSVCTLVTSCMMTPTLIILWKQRLVEADSMHRMRVLFLALFTTSLSFFLASYQVHEKSILLPALPISALAGEFPLLSYLFCVTAAWSLWPLYVLDNTTLAAVALVAAYAVLAFPWHLPAWVPSLVGICSASRSYSVADSLPEERLLMKLARVDMHSARRALKWLTLAIAGGVTMLTAAAVHVPPPSRLPDLHPYLAATTSAAIFVLCWAAGVGLAWNDEGGATRQSSVEPSKEA